MCVFFLAVMINEDDDDISSLAVTESELQRLYGSVDDRRALLLNENKHGSRELARPKLDNNSKTNLMATMEQYFVDKGLAVPSNMEDRYANVYILVKEFVITQVLPSLPGMQHFTMLSPFMRKLFSLMGEDFVFDQLNLETDGLPLFATKRHYAINYFLISTIKSVVSKKDRSMIMNREPAIGVSYTMIYKTCSLFILC